MNFLIFVVVNYSCLSTNCSQACPLIYLLVLLHWFIYRHLYHLSYLGRPGQGLFGDIVACRKLWGPKPANTSCARPPAYGKRTWPTQIHSRSSAIGPSENICPLHKYSIQIFSKSFQVKKQNWVLLIPSMWSQPNWDPGENVLTSAAVAPTHRHKITC
jgi:hypothetical protein